MKKSKVKHGLYKEKRIQHRIYHEDCIKKNREYLRKYNKFQWTFRLRTKTRIDSVFENLSRRHRKWRSDNEKEVS